MIAYLKGTLAEKQPMRVVLDVGGVGYEVSIPLSSYDRLPPVGDACRVLTYDYVREDTRQLFGFTTETERRMFVMLMSISGIGPRLALAALSGLTVRELTVAIVEGDVKRLSSVSGIGKKMAERMVVELRDKLSDGEAMEAVAGAGEHAQSDTRLRDAVLALLALGYKQEQARKMVRKVIGTGEPPDVDDIIRMALAG
jgi:holliday junction DNA helicase RuvA